MKSILRASVLLVVTLALGMLSAAGQTPAAGSKPVGPSGTEKFSDKFEMGLTITYEFAKVSNLPGSRFTMFGGSTDGVYTFGGKTKGLGVAFDIGLESATGIGTSPTVQNPSGPGVADPPYSINLSQFTAVVGPRYTWAPKKFDKHKFSVYGQGLVGGVHAFDTFLANGSTSANSLAAQVGGGLNMFLVKGVGLRLLEADYVMTRLPNNANNLQSDLRLSNGVTFHF